MLREARTTFEELVEAIINELISPQQAAGYSEEVLGIVRGGIRMTVEDLRGMIHARYSYEAQRRNRERARAISEAAWNLFDQLGGVELVKGLRLLPYGTEPQAQAKTALVAGLLNAIHKDEKARMKWAIGNADTGNGVWDDLSKIADFIGRLTAIADSFQEEAKWPVNQRDIAKKHCVAQALTLMESFGKQPTTSPRSSYFTIASLLLEATTGEKSGLERLCKKFLKRLRARLPERP